MSPPPPQEKIIERIVYVDRPVEVELTAKSYKRAMIVGKEFQVLGILVIIASIWISFYLSKFWQYFTVGTAILGVFMVLAGYIWQKWNQYMAWWNNG